MQFANGGHGDEHGGDGEGLTKGGLGSPPPPPSFRLSLRRATSAIVGTRRGQHRLSSCTRCCRWLSLVLCTTAPPRSLLPSPPLFSPVLSTMPLTTSAPAHCYSSLRVSHLSLLHDISTIHYIFKAVIL